MVYSTKSNNKKKKGITILTISPCTKTLVHAGYNSDVTPLTFQIQMRILHTPRGPREKLAGVLILSGHTIDQ